ncbi:hypothetical protein BDF14DRAFT_1806613 [Spinellus fusiger]|nr:hypothetical protein BDF14DRAFT_1806613 [Spinellus fusiger]
MSLPSWATVLIGVLVPIATIAIVDYVYSRFTKRSFVPAGKYCFITGGSTGLGKSLAHQLVAAGANVCIIARRVSELEKAIQEIEAVRQNETQKIFYISADITFKEDVIRAFDEAKLKFGQNPDTVLSCAGASYPKLFLDSPLDEFDYLTRLNYLGQAYIAHEGCRRMRDDNIKNGKIVFVSSLLCLLSFAGYSTYSPTKFAVRGLADTLRNELKPYGIDVHLFVPGNIDSPGYVTENLNKPEVTKILDGASDPQSPDDCAKSLMSGLYSGHYVIVTDLLGDFIRASTRGVTPSNYFVIDFIYAVIGQFFASGFVFFMDYEMSASKKREDKAKKIALKGKDN